MGYTIWQMSQKKRNARTLSVIVPCYKLESTVVKSLKTIETFLKTTGYNYEIIAVVDGNVDKTYERAKRIRSPHIKAVSYNTNRGKGYALRYGMARSTGEVIAFIDGGRDLDPAGLQMLLSHFDWYDADIIVGSKWHPVSIVEYPWWRKIISKSYGTLVKLLFGLRVSDTQLGMKCFRRDVLEDVLPRLLVKKFAVDIEMLAVANHLGYTRIYECPVVLNWHKIDSHISKNLAGSIMDTFLDTLAVFYRLYFMHYYDDGQKRIWEYDPDLHFNVNVD